MCGSSCSSHPARHLGYKVHASDFPNSAARYAALAVRGAADRQLEVLSGSNEHDFVIDAHHGARREAGVVPEPVGRQKREAIVRGSDRVPLANDGEHPDGRAERVLQMRESRAVRARRSRSS